MKAVLQDSPHHRHRRPYPMSASPIVPQSKPRKRRPVADRFWEKVTKIDTCWLWVGCLRHPSGYGAFYNRNTMVHAHRWSYEQVHGPIPADLQIDHLCRVRHCVNPAHLEAVTQRENLIRGEGFAGKQSRQTHCKYGHAFTEDNTYVNSKGGRRCRTCKRNWQRARREAKKAQLLA